MAKPLVAAVIVAIALAWLSLEASPGGLAFEMGTEEGGFGSSRGWPLKAVAPANDVGAHQVDASLVQGGSTVYRNRRSDPRLPHLIVNWTFVFVDLIVAILAVSIAAFLPLIIRRLRRVESGPPRG